MKEYLTKLIDNYKNEISIEKKEKIAKDIYTFYQSILTSDYYSKRYLKEIKNKYKEVSNKNIFNRAINKQAMDKTIPNQEEYIKQANTDLPYINDLMKNIILDDTVYIEKEKKSNDKQKLLDYINCSDEFKKFLSAVNYDEIIDVNLRENSLLQLPSDKFILLLNSDNILTKIDGLMDMYNGYSFDRFYRVPCDLAELALSKYYNLSTTIDRYQNITDLKLLRSGIKSSYEYDAYCYGIASLLARTFVEKYGTDFNKVLEAANILKNNINIPLKSKVRELGLNENDIRENVKRYEKIIKH